MSRLSLRKRKVAVPLETPESEDDRPRTLKKARPDDSKKVLHLPLSPLRNKNENCRSSRRSTISSRENNSDDLKIKCSVMAAKLRSSVKYPVAAADSSQKGLISPTDSPRISKQQSPHESKIGKLPSTTVEPEMGTLTRSQKNQSDPNEETMFRAGTFYRDVLKSPTLISLRSRISPATLARRHVASPTVSRDTTPAKIQSRKTVSAKTTLINVLRTPNPVYSGSTDNEQPYRTAKSALTTHKSLERPPGDQNSPAAISPTAKSRKFFSQQKRESFTTTTLKFGEQKISTPSRCKPKARANAAKRGTRKNVNTASSKPKAGTSKKQRSLSSSQPCSPNSTLDTSKSSLISDTVNDERLPECLDFMSAMDESSAASPAPLLSRDPSDSSHKLFATTDLSSPQEEISSGSLFSDSDLVGSGKGNKENIVIDFLDMGEDDFLMGCSSLARSDEPSAARLSSTELASAPHVLKTKQKSPRSSGQGNLKSWLADSRTNSKDGKEQLMIDVGQQNVGPTMCRECGMLYGKECSDDKAIHYKIHNKVVFNLRFSGWKKERIVKEYLDGKVLQILPEDPKYAQKKVEEVMEVVNMTLGFHEKARPDSMSMQVFLFVSEKTVVGALIANTIKQAYRCVPRPDDTKPFACSLQAEPAICGINRIWTLASHRRKRIATRLMKCMRDHFYYGWVLSKEQLAFSDPTPDGQLFAKNYMQSETFLVYK